jgi:hypothetical protein
MEHAAAVRQVAGRIHDRMDDAAKARRSSLRFPAIELIEGFQLTSAAKDFELLATLMGRSATSQLPASSPA